MCSRVLGLLVKLIELSQLKTMQVTSNANRGVERKSTHIATAQQERKQKQTWKQGNEKGTLADLGKQDNCSRLDSDLQRQRQGEARQQVAKNRKEARPSRARTRGQKKEKQ